MLVSVKTSDVTKGNRESLVFFCGHKSTIERRPSQAEWKRVPTVKRQLDKQSWKVKLSAHSIFVQPRVKLYRRDGQKSIDQRRRRIVLTNWNSTPTRLKFHRYDNKQARMTNLCRFYDVQTIPATRDGRQAATMVWAIRLMNCCRSDCWTKRQEEKAFTFQLFSDEDEKRSSKVH